MSAQEQLDFDFWEFVSCAKCRMPFALDNGGSTVPFWLTECGHVICNSHLNPDQSCSQCGARDIQLAPLQREMEAPMSDWFQPIPQVLDSVAYAVKFQQDAMASQLRYYRSRHQQFRQIFERFKKDLSDLKKENETIRRENDHLRLQMSQQGDEAYAINSNGKRQMTTAHESSSSRSIRTPIGPNRLTLQPGQSVPELSHGEPNARPVSSLSLDRYAYKGLPDDNHGYAPPTLSHAQSAPRAFQRFQPQSCQPRTQKNVSQTTTNEAVPSSSRFKPQGLPAASSSRNHPTGHFNANMGPPPTPQHHSHQNMDLMRNASNPTYLPPASRQQIQVSMPSTSSGQRSMASASTRQRFFPGGHLPQSSRTGAT